MGIASTSRFFDETAALRERVEQLLRTAHELPELEVSQRIDAIEGTVTFIAEVLFPRAYAEERVLYPAASRLLDGADESGSVREDRAQLRRLIRGLGTADPRDSGRLQELLYALYLLLTAHFHREDGIYVKLLADQPDARVRQLLERVGAYERMRRFARSRLDSVAE